MRGGKTALYRMVLYFATGLLLLGYLAFFFRPGLWARTDVLAVFLASMACLYALADYTRICGRDEIRTLSLSSPPPVDHMTIFSKEPLGRGTRPTSTRSSAPTGGATWPTATF